jgi:hypothetical protein
LSVLADIDTRRRHQVQVAALLDELEEGRRRIRVRQAYGVSPAGLRDLTAELGAVRSALAAAVDGEAA